MDTAEAEDLSEAASMVTLLPKAVKNAILLATSAPIRSLPSLEDFLPWIRSITLKSIRRTML